MSTLPGTVIPWVEERWFDDNGVPLAFGKIYFYVTGTTTPQDTWTVADPLDDDHLNTNPVILDATGRPDSLGIFFGPYSYKVVVTDADDVTQYTMDGVASWSAFISGLGTVFATGSSNVTSGYSVISTDQMVTISGTGGASPCVIQLPAAVDRSTAANGNGLPVALKNIGTIALSVVPDGSDTIEGLNVAYSVPAASGVNHPTIVLLSDGVSSWLIWASHGF